MQVSIKGLDKAEVLLALYNNSKAQGMSFFALPKTPVTLEECREALLVLERREDYLFYFDYWKGKVLKVSLAGDEFDAWGYDRDNGEGAAQRAVDALRSK